MRYLYRSPLRMNQIFQILGWRSGLFNLFNRIFGHVQVTILRYFLWNLLRKQVISWINNPLIISFSSFFFFCSDFIKPFILKYFSLRFLNFWLRIFGNFFKIFRLVLHFLLLFQEFFRRLQQFWPLIELILIHFCLYLFACL